MGKAEVREPIYEVSIVVPIYNGGEFIVNKLESLKGIEGVKYEVVIALNKSIDNSEELIDFHGKEIPNLKVIKHSVYRDGGKNFQSGVEASSGQFIFVSAVDDICDKDFYCEAVKILNQRQSVCAVTPQTVFEDNSHGSKPVAFELSGNTEERIRTLFQNIRVSHGIFYSLIRRRVATNLYRDFFKDYSFIGGDWLFDLKLALEGEVLRVSESKCVFGVKGVSRNGNHLSPAGTTYYKTILPYSKLAVNIIRLSRGQKPGIKLLLFKFSLRLLKGNIHRYIYSFSYIRKIREVIKKR